MPQNLPPDQLQSQQADKGGNIVLMTDQQYIEMCMGILSNRSWYRQIAASSTNRYINEYKLLIGDAYHMDLIDQDTHAYLDTKFPRTAPFFALPKLHKNIHAPPGRPIVSGIGSLTENASRLIDFFLTPCHMTAIFRP